MATSAPILAALLLATPRGAPAQVFPCVYVGPFVVDVASWPGVPAGAGELAVTQPAPARFACTDFLGRLVTPPGIVPLPGSDACMDRQPLGAFRSCPIAERGTDAPGLTLYRIGI